LEEVFDPTGAGDSFAGGLMGYLSSQEEVSFDSLKKAVIAGSAVASFCVEKFGTQRLEEITRNDIAKRMSMLHQLTHFELTGYGAA
jgi:sugar/nucleoside kinase (ribokinase family)